MAEKFNFGVERRCMANEICAAMSRSLDLPVFAFGNPDHTVTFHCDLCKIYICGCCSKRVLTTIQLFNRRLKLWQMCCPRCGFPLGDATSECTALYSTHSEVVGFLNNKAGVWSISNSDSKTNLQSTIENIYEHHYQRALMLLYTFKTQISINGSIMLVDKAIAEFPGESLSWFFKALLCHHAGYHIAGRNAWNTLLASDGVTKSPSPIEIFKLNKEKYENCSKNLQHYSDCLKAIEHDCVFQRNQIFRTDLAAFDKHFQAYQQGKISYGNFVRDLFKNASKLPEVVKIFLEALHYEETLNFSSVEADRQKLIQLLVEKLDHDQVTALLSRSLALRLGSVSQTDFYIDLKKVAEKTGIDLSSLPAFSSYLRYITLSGSIDSQTMLSEVWTAIQREYYKRAKLTEDHRLIVVVTRLDLLRCLLNYLSGHTSVARIPGTYASNPSAMRELAESLREKEKPKVSFWKKIFGRS